MRASLLLVLWLAAPAAGAVEPRLVARAGDPSPIGILSSFSDPTIDAAGRVAFVGTSSGLFTAGGSGLVHLLVAGDRLPDGRLVTDVGVPALAAGGCLVVRIVTAGGDGIYRRCGAAVTPLVERDVAAPHGGRIVAFGALLAASRSGQPLFTGTLDDGTTGLFTLGSGGLVEIARTGEFSPGGGTFTSFRPVGVSDAGAAGFRFTASGGPDGFFTWNGSTLLRVALVNDPTPAGSQFKELDQATMNAAGTWAFLGQLADGSGGGIFRADLSAGFARLAVVVRSGQPSPIGGTYKQVPSSLAPSLNTSGAIAFRATLSGALFSSGAFVAAPSGVVTRVVATGEQTSAGKLVQVRNPLLADDGSVLVPATTKGGRAAYYVVRAGQVRELAALGTPTDVGAPYALTAASVRETAEGAVLAGARAAVLAGVPGGPLAAVATVGGRTPLRGVYVSFDPPAAGPAGRLVFRAQLQDARAAEALFLAQGRHVRVLVPARRRVAGGRIIQFDSSGIDAVMRPSVARGRVGFQARVEGKEAFTGVYLARGGALETVARQGRRAPGGGRYAVFDVPAFGPSGSLAFLARLDGAPGDVGLFLGRPTALRPLTYTGQPTGTRLGGRFRALDQPAGGATGVVFHAALDLPGVDGIFWASGRRVDALAGSGDALAGGGSLGTTAMPTTAGNAVVFIGAATGSGAPGGLFRMTVPATAPPAELLQLGTASPLGGTFLDLGQPAVNAAGQIAVTADLADAPSASAVLALGP